MQFPLELTRWIIPLIALISGLIAGLIFERFILKKLKRIAARTQFPGHQLIFESLKRLPRFWFFLAGVYGAILGLQLNPTLRGILGKILIAIFLYTVTLVLGRLASGFVTAYGSRPDGVLPSASLLSNLARILVFVFGILMILQTLGISITPILTTLGIGGLAVALALQDTLSNLFSGLYLLISKQVRPGDYVRLESGEEGYVTDITWRNTTIKELPNNLIVVPNSKLASAIFKNYHLPVKQITLQIPVGVDYDSNLEQVENVTIEVAKEVMQAVSGNVENFEPFIRYHTFGDYRIDFTVFLSVNEFFDLRLAKHEFVKRLHKRYREEGIKIPIPTAVAALQRLEKGEGQQI